MYFLSGLSHPSLIKHLSDFLLCILDEYNAEYNALNNKADIYIVFIFEINIDTSSLWYYLFLLHWEVNIYTVLNIVGELSAVVRCSKFVFLCTLVVKQVYTIPLYIGHGICALATCVLCASFTVHLSVTDL